MITDLYSKREVRLKVAAAGPGLFEIAFEKLLNYFNVLILKINFKK